MKVTFQGFRNKEEIRILTELSNFVTDYQMGEAKYDIKTIIYNQDISLLSRRRWAECVAVPDGVNNPSHFMINILPTGRGMPFVSMLRQAAHELTHVKHFATGALRFRAEGFIFWEGIVYEPGHFANWHEPWEVDARSMEKAMTELFFEENGYHHAPWFQNIP